MHFAVSPSERNNFQHSSSFLAFWLQRKSDDKRGGKRKKIYICRKVSSCQLFFMQTAHFASPQISPYWQPRDRTQQDAPLPQTVGKTVPSSGTLTEHPVMKWFPESSLSSVHFLSIFFSAFFPQHRQNSWKKNVFLSPCAFVFVLSYFVSSPFQLKQWVWIFGSKMVSQLFFFLLLRAGKL